MLREGMTEDRNTPAKRMTGDRPRRRDIALTASIGVVVMLVLAVRCSARAMTTGSGITINAVRKAVSLGARSRSSMIQEHMQRLRYGTRAHSPQ